MTRIRIRKRIVHTNVHPDSYKLGYQAGWRECEQHYLLQLDTQSSKHTAEEARLEDEAKEWQESSMVHEEDLERASDVIRYLLARLFMPAKDQATSPILSNEIRASLRVLNLEIPKAPIEEPHIEVSDEWVDMNDDVPF